MHKIRHKGRPFGGLLWIIDSEINKIAETFFISDKISCCKLKQNNHHILIIGIYGECNDKLYSIQLNQITKIIREQNDNSKIMLMGDFNAANIRVNNGYDKVNRIQRNITKVKYPNDVKYLEFLNNNGLECLDLKFVQRSDHTFKMNEKKSHIDHVIIKSKDNWENIVQVNIITPNSIPYIDQWDAQNLSDHKPVEVTLNIDLDATTINNNWKKTPKIIERFSWTHKKEQYSSALDTMLVKEDILGKLRHIHNDKLTKAESLTQLDDTINALYQCMTLAKAAVTDKYIISHNKFGKRKRYWDAEIKQVYANKRAQELNKTSALYEKEIHNYYRNKFRRLQRQGINKIRNEDTSRLNAKYKNNILELWKEIKSHTRTQNFIEVKFETICEHYKKTFEKEQVHDDAQEEIQLNELMRTVENTQGDVYITENTVNKILGQLKNDKATGKSKICNEMFKFGNRQSMTLITQLLLIIIINKHIMPSNMNIGLTFPLLKDQKGSNKDLKNTRPITLSEVIDIIYEMYIMEVTDKCIHLQPFQFGFNKAVSTQHAIFVLKETLMHQLTLNLMVYLIFLDFSQAFDKVNKTKLLLKLHNSLNAHVWLSLAKYMKSASIIVKNSSEISSRIPVDTGVKQGGPISPRLFAVYIDQLISSLLSSSLLCKVGAKTTGIICYADDIAIACNTKTEAQKALKLVETYCLENQIKINTEKTKWMCFGTYNQLTKVKQDSLMINKVIFERERQRKKIN
jgi:virulence-associated protein VapD